MKEEMQVKHRKDKGAMRTCEWSVSCMSIWYCCKVEERERWRLEAQVDAEKGKKDQPQITC